MDNMQYRFLGDTGLKVSVLGYGMAVFEEQAPLDDILPSVLKSGINFIDLAEAYGQQIGKHGHVESLFGNFFKKSDIPREDLVITTKFIANGNGPNRRGLSYKHVVKGMEASLKRLQLDYVDIAFAHRDDIFTPMEEICRGFNTLIEEGHAFYWATSEWSADRIMEAFAVCDRLGLIRPIAEQPEYNLLVREKMEKEYVNLFENYHYGTTIWSPLASGILTGKYNDTIPEDTRLTPGTAFAQFMQKYKVEENRIYLKQIADLSKEVGSTMTQFALAWALRNKDVSTAIIGARKPAQLEDNLKALEFIDSITPEIEEKVEKIMNNRPAPGLDFRTWAPLKPRRVVATL